MKIDDQAIELSGRVRKLRSELKNITYMARYKQGVENEWHKPLKRKYKWGCCDCGLIHEVDFKAVDKDGKEIKGATVLIRVRRNNRSTAQMRRHRGIQINVEYDTVDEDKG